MDRRERRNPSSGKGRRRQAGRSSGTNLPRVPNRPRRVSRAQREARRQRQLRLGLGIAAAVVILVLGIGITWDQFVKPNQVVAEVNGVRIRRDNYWRYRAVELINQISSYQQFANSATDAQQQQQYSALALRASEELDDLWGSRDVNDDTVQRMIEDQIYLQNLEPMGLTITDEQVDLWIYQQFAPFEAPLVTPTAEPTLIPERAAWATQTAEAAGVGSGTPPSGTPDVAATPIADSDTPVSAATPVVDSTAPLATPVSDGTPAANAATPEASPETDGTPGLETPTVAPTPNPEEALSTAEAGFDQYKDVVFDRAHMSQSDYERLIARPSLAREMINSVLQSQVPQSAEQVRAAHILVDTLDLATELRAQLNDPNVSFEQLAMQNSTDTSTAPNGGDLGWFPRGAMVAPFEEAAFSLAPGEISEPVQTEFGYHLIKVYERADDRALTDAQYEAAKNRAVETWVADRLAEATIESDIDPTPTIAPGVEQFEAPVDAPTPPAPTSTPAPAATPVAGGSPVASPAASSESSTPAVGGTPSIDSSTPAA